MTDERKPVAWLSHDLIMQTSDVITNKWLAERRAASTYAGSPAWKVEPLYSEATVKALEAERDEARNLAENCKALMNDAIRVGKRDVAAAETRVAQLEAALEPSADTKAAYDGKFSMGVELRLGRQYENRSVRVPWDVIRQIMAAIRVRALLSEGGPDA